MKSNNSSAALALALLSAGCADRESVAEGTGASEDTLAVDEEASTGEAGTTGLGSSDGGSTDDDQADDSTTGSQPGACPDGVSLLTLSGKAGVEIMIDGQGPFAFIVDTGAPTTVVDPSVIEAIGNGTHVVEVAGETLAATSAFDQLPIRQLFPDAVGVLGWDLLGSYAVHFDYPRARFWIDEGAGEEDLLACAHVQAEPQTVALQPFGGYLWVRGAMEGHEGWLLVDTGATLGAVVDSAFETLQAAAARPALEGFYTEAIVATFWAELTTLGDVSIAGAPVESILARTIPEFQLPPPPDDSAPMLGLLPTPFMRHFLVTVDAPGGTLRIDRAAGDPGVEAPQFFPLGIGTELSTAPPIAVGQIMPGSAAAEQGVEVGDRIVAVGGQSFDAIPAASRPWSLVTFVEGEVRQVTLERDGEPYEVALTGRDLLSPP